MPAAIGIAEIDRRVASTGGQLVGSQLWPFRRHSKLSNFTPNRVHTDFPMDQHWLIVGCVELGAVIVLAWAAVGALSRIEIPLNFHGGNLGRKATRWENFVNGCGMAVVFALLFGLVDLIVAFVFPQVISSIKYAMTELGVGVTQLLIAIFVILLGLAAHLFKKKNQLKYGLVEILFAAATAIIAARQLVPNMSWAGPLATLGGSMYIVSRGLDNVAKGHSDKKAAKKAARQLSELNEKRKREFGIFGSVEEANVEPESEY
jgi:hypothetical protein